MTDAWDSGMFVVVSMRFSANACFASASLNSLPVHHSTISGPAVAYPSSWSTFLWKDTSQRMHLHRNKRAIIDEGSHNGHRLKRSGRGERQVEDERPAGKSLSSAPISTFLAFQHRKDPGKHAPLLR